MRRCLLTVTVLLSVGVAMPSHASTAAAPTSSSVAASAVHWRVALKVWIPFAHTVEPTALSPKDPQSGQACYILGSGHVAYKGDFQAMRWADFDVGRSGDAANVVSADAYGPSGRPVSWRPAGESRTRCSPRSQAWDVKTSSSVLGSSRGAGAWDALARSGDLELHIAATLPMSPPLASPSITADVALVLSNAGRDGASDANHDSWLSVQYRTTRFPSIGLNVQANDQPRATLILNDASCLRPVLGAAGAANLADGLAHASNRGALRIGNHVVLPDEQPGFDAIGRTHYVGGGFGYDIDPTASAPSGLCSKQDVSAFFPR